MFALSKSFIEIPQQSLALCYANVPQRQPTPYLFELWIENVDQVGVARELDQSHVDDKSERRTLVETTK